MYIRDGPGIFLVSREIALKCPGVHHGLSPSTNREGWATGDRAEGVGASGKTRYLCSTLPGNLRELGSQIHLRAVRRGLLADAGRKGKQFQG